MPIPAPDEIPPELDYKQQQQPRMTSDPDSKDAADAKGVQHLMVPMSSRTLSNNSDGSQGSSNPAQSLPSPTSPIANGSFSSAAPMFRSRAKTLASLTTATRLGSQTDLMPREIQLPVDPLVNGQPIEAHLYKDAAECPICFLYYPPYLNRTRCCDQPICSECFVQIKRPDPHPPEHGDDPNNPNNAIATTTTTTTTQEEGGGGGGGSQAESADTQLVSEAAACPFCVQPEFGVTYVPPTFRRGLAYATEPTSRPAAAANLASPMSSSTSSLSSANPTSTVPGRRRATSLSASDPNVVTTDKIRPDWAQKLTNARAHAARRSAAATALHTAAYLVNSNNPSDSRNFGLGRRRRASAAPEAQSQSQARGSPALNALAFLTDRRAQQPSPQSETQSQSPSQSPSQAQQSQAQSPLPELDPADEGPAPPPRGSSRRTRLDDLEEMMMMEAIRLSLASEEDRRKREEKDMKKEAKKRDKEAKKVEKTVRKSASAAASASTGSEASSSAPNYGRGLPSSSSSVIEEEEEPPAAKGKAPAPVPVPGGGPGPAAAAGPALEATSSGSEDDRQASAAAAAPTTEPSKPSHLRHMSSASSSISSLVADEHVANADSSTSSEPLFNFRSLAAVIGDGDGDEDDKAEQGQQTEHVEHRPSESAASDATAKAEPEPEPEPGQGEYQPEQRECLLPKELETRSVEITGTHPAT